ncbi:MAG: PilN domain-containing protein, partial [Caldisericia bacterium]|nr:PilN domain-containing protein [Caldisericia bacterium]
FKLIFIICALTEILIFSFKFSDFFKTLSSEFPKYAYITSIDIDLDTKVVRIVGETSDFYNLGRLINYLKDSKAITNVYLSNFSRQEVTQTGESKVSFTLIGIIQTGGGK